jgi:hypothetical protein
MLRRTLALCFAVLFLTVSLAHATPANIWAHRYGGTDDKGFNELVVDPFGNMVGLGYFYDTLTINSLFTSLGAADIFVAKFDGNGNPLWSKHLGGAFGDNAFDVTTDRVGNVIAVGSTNATLSDGNMYVVKYAPDGTQRFLKTFGAGDDSTQAAEYVTTDLSKNIIVSGEFNGSLNLGGATLHNQGAPTVFLAKLDQNGNHIWSKRFLGSTEFLFSLGGMETSVDGQTTLFGILDGTLNFGNGPLSTAGGADIFLARFDANGNVLWAHKYGDVGDQYPGNIAINESGQIAMIGYASSSFTLGGTTLTPAGGFDPFLGVFTPEGTHVWSKMFTGAGTQYGLDVTWASNQDVLMTARGNGTLNFGGGPVTIAGTNYGVWLARFFGANGNHRWSTSFTSTGGMDANIEESKGNLYLAGGVGGDVNFGTGLLTGTAAFDVYLARFADNITGVSSPVIMSTLGQNVPNPFNPRTTISYTLDARARAVVAIYDAAGAVVTRIDEGMQPAGAHSVTWDGRDHGGKPVASGVYFYRLEGIPSAGARKMILLK